MIFQQWTSHVDAQFWNNLAEDKLNVHHLNEDALPLTAYYNSGCIRGLLPRICLSGSLPFSKITPPFTWPIHGILVNTNTIEAFKSIDKIQKLYEVTVDLLAKIESQEILLDLGLLNQFLMFTFADLKNYQFYYWFAFPTLSLKGAVQLVSFRNVSEIFSGEMRKILFQNYANFAKVEPTNRYSHSSFVFFINKEEASVRPFSDFQSCLIDAKYYLAIVDSSSHASQPGTNARNVISYVTYLLRNTLKLDKKSINVLFYRENTREEDIGMSIFCEIHLPETADFELSRNLLGSFFERNEALKLSPRSVDLRSTLDPRMRAASAADLNLKLMKWRLFPSLKLDTLQSLRCLLLGVGTLGCHVARLLMGWGVRNLTLVDNGYVNYSNPVRQCLFRLDDAIQHKTKVDAAVNAILEIAPMMNVKGHFLSIPMPGHDIQPDQLNLDVNQLDQLIRENDVVFLLTDSRESRWLPTLLCQVYDKLAINAALGFESYLVMRHGVSGQELGCYFCADVVAPRDSSREKSLDRQCTVSRNGVSMMASSLAVELMVNVLHHTLERNAPADAKVDGLGIVPHQIRGFLGDFQQLLLSSPRYDLCTACSPKIINSYKQMGIDFISSVTRDPLILEKITGLDELHKKTEQLISSLSIDEVESSDEDATSIVVL